MIDESATVGRITPAREIIEGAGYGTDEVKIDISVFQKLDGELGYNWLCAEYPYSVDWLI